MRFYIPQRKGIKHIPRALRCQQRQILIAVEVHVHQSDQRSCALKRQALNRFPCQRLQQAAILRFNSHLQNIPSRCFFDALPGIRHSQSQHGQIRMHLTGVDSRIIRKCALQAQEKHSESKNDSPFHQPFPSHQSLCST